MTRACRAAVALVVGAIAAAPAFARPARGAQGPGSGSVPSAGDALTRQSVLDVPYVPQSEALCGGAAAAMVLRYWGARNVQAEDFTPLLNTDRSGIRTDRLAAAIRDRGWNAVEIDGTDTIVREQLANRRPVIALVSVGNHRYHYVVLTAWTDAEVVAHDPARAPDRAYQPRAFEAAWSKARRWMLVITPKPNSSPESGSGMAPTGGGNGGGRSADDTVADKIKSGAIADAVALATAAVRRSPADPDAWYLLGAAQYLNRNTNAALDAWNRIGEPKLDLVRVDGIRESSYASVANIVGIGHGEVITTDGLATARRRISDLPAVASARVDVEPRGQGLAQIDVGVIEKSTLPRSRAEIVIAGARAAIDREIAESFSNLNGSGDAWSASWRWWENRPRIAFSVAAPGLLGTHAVWRLDGSWEAQSYAADAAGRATSGLETVREERTRAALSGSNWLSPLWKWEARSGLDRWAAHGAFGFGGGALTRRSLDDRVETRLDGDLWFGSTTFARLGFRTTRISKLAPVGWRTLAAGGASYATADAPLDLWDGAGVGHARAPLLRAHPLLDDGVISGPAFGRSLEHATIAIERWPATMKLWGAGIAAFVDAAGAQHRLESPLAVATVPGRLSNTWLADAGAGLRLRAAWLPGVVRVDFAHGLRDGADAVSVGWATVDGR